MQIRQKHSVLHVPVALSNITMVTKHSREGLRNMTTCYYVACVVADITRAMIG